LARLPALSPYQCDDPGAAILREHLNGISSDARLGLSGYQIIALTTAAAAPGAFSHRQRSRAPLC
jgi:hypothetical protein